MKTTFKGFLVLLFSMTLISTASWAYSEVPTAPETEDGAGDNENKEDNRQQTIIEAAKTARNRGTAVAIACGAASAYFGYQCATGQLGSCAVAAIALSSAIATTKWVIDKDEQIQRIIDDSGEQDTDGDGTGGHCVSVHACNDDSHGDSTSPDIKDQQHQIQKAKELLAGSGYGVDENGNIKTPQGTFSPDQMTPSTMSSLGVTPELQAEYRAKMQEEIAKASAQREAGAIAGGGGGGPAKVLRAQRDNSSWSQNAPARGLASVDGLSVRRGDDLIGIQSADIFEMVHKKYQELRKNNTFME